MMSWKGAVLSALVASAAMRSAPALALTYTIETDRDGGFNFSWLHAATHGGSSGFYHGGEAYLRLSGSLNARVDGPVFEVSPSQLTATARPGNTLGYTGNWTLRIGGGHVDASVPAGALMGSFTYELLDDENELYDSGAFYFFNRHFAGTANSASLNGLSLWGNNWNPLEMSRADFVSTGGHPFGADFGGTFATPEPASVTLLGTALLGGWYARRRRSPSRA